MPTCLNPVSKPIHAVAKCLDLCIKPMHAVLVLLVGVAVTASCACAQRGLGKAEADGEYSWQKPHATVLPHGDLEWSPRPHTFESGSRTFYIDFASGDDAHPGTRAQPWKHHPWDHRATGRSASASGPATYVFKGGVTYRGKLLGTESGTPGEPIRLTCDPAWGDGSPARVYGSKRVTGSWRRGDARSTRRIPEPETVWYVDLPEGFDPGAVETRLSNLWMIDGAGRVVRMHLARDPDHEVTDRNYPLKHWKRWEAFDGTRGEGYLIDSDRKGKPKGFFDGAFIYSQHRGLMGTPHRLGVQDYDPDRGGFKVRTPGGGSLRWPPGGKGQVKYNREVRYFIENVPEYLDSPYEYYFDAAGAHANRLYVRLPQGVEPGDVTFEAGVVRSPIEIRDAAHIEISGLSFSFNNEDDGTYGYPWHLGVGAMVRVVGNCSEIAVRNNRFYNVVCAVSAFPRPWSGKGGAARLFRLEVGDFRNDRMENIRVADNDVRDSLAFSAIVLAGSSTSTGKRDRRPGRLGYVEVLRNRVVNSGSRPGKSPTGAMPAIGVTGIRRAHIAGNVVDTSWGSGIFTLGGKHSGGFEDVPLTRILVHHNKLENLMLACNDYGGLEHFQGGPIYQYNNVIRNVVGTTTFTHTELGYAFYWDGGFKLYGFNNILSGRIDPDNPDYYSHGAFWTVFGFLNNFWNNTVYRFDMGTGGSSGNRSAILGNVFVDMKKAFIAQNRPGDVSQLGGGDTGEQGRSGVASMAYGANVFHGEPRGGAAGTFGYVGGSAPGSRFNRAEVYGGDTLEELSEKLEMLGARDSSLGVHTSTPPLADPARGQFQPRPGSAVRNMGVKFFVPWSLARVVGEWSFQPSANDPATVNGEHFYMSEDLIARSMYYFVPRHHLRVNEADLGDYVDGPLEDWTRGALRFDGSRFAALSHADQTAPYSYRIRNGELQTRKRLKHTTLDMAENNFLIELYFRVDKLAGPAGLVGKMGDDAGYALSLDGEGRLRLDLASADEALPGRAGVTGPRVERGKWLHLIVEADRLARRVRFYVDGKLAAQGRLDLLPGVSLANEADFLVGKSADNRYFTGAIDFLRVSRGTLADARTTIDELYAWQFEGPFLRDFIGRRPAEGKRDAGAIEAHR
jgi:hypothetical protein